MEASTSIREWYKNETVFITGGSGYIGKGVIFKLLQCGTSKIYVLIRTKKGQSPEERLDLVANHWIYDSLRAEGIDVRSKLIAVAGDVTEPKLSITEKDRVILQDNVTVVLHIAASVKFDDPLKMAVFYNLRSTRDVVDLAKGMKKLKIFHHVSTAYCNIDRMKGEEYVMEKVYPPTMKWQKMIEIVENNSVELISAVEKKIIGSHYNTYLFTKQLAENVIKDAANDIPVIISRPPIVTSSLKEPYPGWIDNLSSPILLAAGAAKGVIRVFLCSETAKKSYVPLDVTVNMILVSSWNEAIIKKGDADGQVKVIMGEHSRATTIDFAAHGLKVLKKHPFHNCLWPVKNNSTSDLNVFLIGHLLLHVLPGMFIDLILRLCGKKPLLLKIYRTFYNVYLNLELIVLTCDYFDYTNYTDLKKQIPDEEVEVFQLNAPQTDHTIYEWLKVSVTGVRKFLGEPEVPTPGDLAHAKRLYWLDIGFQITMALLFFWVFPFHYLLAPFLYIADSVTEFLDSV